MKVVDLQAAAWDGSRVWLADTEGRLLGIEGDSGKMAVNRRLDTDLSDSETFAVGGGTLFAVARDGSNDSLRLLRISTKTGEVGASPIGRGRPLGQAFLRDDRLIVADYTGAIDSLNPSTGATESVIKLDVLPNLVQPGPEGTYWVIDDERARLLRVDGDGRSVVDLRRPQRKPGATSVASLAADNAGNAWLAERTTVVVVNGSGQTVREVNGFRNATTVMACGEAVIASDIETGEVAWLDITGREQRLGGTSPGRVIACAPNGAWFLSVDGFLTRIPEPAR